MPRALSFFGGVPSDFAARNIGEVWFRTASPPEPCVNDIDVAAMWLRHTTSNENADISV